MLTAEAGHENVLQIARIGIRDYLVKPFKEDQLIEKVACPFLGKESWGHLIMSEVSTYNEAARLYGLAATPESVLRLTQLVSRQDAELDEAAALITSDPALRRRMLRLANPRAKSEADYTIETVEQALMRNGIGCALLIPKGAPSL